MKAFSFQKQRQASITKSLYIKEYLVKEIEKLAWAHDTSFNKIVVTILENCIEEITGNQE